MRPGQLHANELESALLQCIAEKHPELVDVIPHLHVLSRTYTGVGSFTEFLVKGRPPRARVVLGAPVAIVIPSLTMGLGLAVFWEVDRLTLELVSYGCEKWDGTFEGFNIVDVQLARPSGDSRAIECEKSE